MRSFKHRGTGLGTSHPRPFITHTHPKPGAAAPWEQAHVLLSDPTRPIPSSTWTSHPLQQWLPDAKPQTPVRTTSFLPFPLSLLLPEPPGQAQPTGVPSPMRCAQGIPAQSFTRGNIQQCPPRSLDCPAPSLLPPYRCTTGRTQPPPSLLGASNIQLRNNWCVLPSFWVTTSHWIDNGLYSLIDYISSLFNKNKMREQQLRACTSIHLPSLALADRYIRASC